MAELDAILSGADIDDEPATAAASPGREKPEDSAPPAEPPAPTAGKSEPPPAPTTEPAADDRVPVAALKDERSKRQEFERENAELRRKLEDAERRLAPPRPETVTPEDESLPEDFYENPGKALANVRRQAREEAVAAAEAKRLEHDVMRSERAARKRYADYDEKRAAFAERVQSDPVIRAEFNKAIAEGEDFGDYVYETATKLQQYGGIRSIEDIRAQVRKELEAELAAKRPPAEPAAPVAPVPTSLNATPSPTTTSREWSGPPPLEEILQPRKRSNAT